MSNMCNGIYYVDDYDGSDDNKISLAVAAAHNANGGKVVLSNRTYSVSQSIILHKNIVFCGVGDISVIECSTDVPIIRIDRNCEDSLNIEISSMTLKYLAMNTSNHFHVEADRPYRLVVCGVTFIGVGRYKSGLLTWMLRRMTKLSL